jgi:predicted RNase H-like HicB family nuclease
MNVFFICRERRRSGLPRNFFRGSTLNANAETKELVMTKRRATEEAVEDMQEAIDKVIEEKKREPIGTDEAKEDVAQHLRKAAEQDTGKSARREERPTGRR